MAQFLSERGIDSIEFYHDGDGKDQLGSILSQTGLDSIYIAVIPSKEKRLHLCDCLQEGRRAAVRLYQECIDEAQLNGISRVMMNSGAMQTDIEGGIRALGESVEELYEYAARRNYTSFSLTMEPCDTKMDACQLMGPVHRTKAFVDSMRKRGFPLELTMDSAHTVEEGEDFFQALQTVKPFCNHIHFANCDITNRESPLYGDKHLGYDFPNSQWTFSSLERLTQQLQALYPGEDPLRIGLEFLCREEDPYAYFQRTWNQLSFIHKA